MSGLGGSLESALGALAAAPTLLVASDFDGTLAPIVTNSWEARAPASTLDALTRLADAPCTFVAVVTGRSLAALRALGPMPGNARLIGSHGAEWSDGSMTPLTADQQAALGAARSAAAGVVDGVPGARLEQKPAGFAVHVRAMPDRELAPQVLDRVRDALGDLAGVRVLPGKQVIEATVVDSSKGAALRRLRDVVGADAVFFAGDDVTDETAFVALGDGDVGVKVGNGPTAAGHRVSDVDALAGVLRWLADARSARSPLR